MRYLFFLFLVFCSTLCLSQDELNDNFFPTKKGLENFEKDLDYGYRAFVLGSDSLSLAELTIVEEFIINNQDESLVFFLPNNEVDKLAKQLPESVKLDKNISHYPVKKSSLILVSKRNFENSFNQFKYSRDTLQGNKVCKSFNFIETDSIPIPEEIDSLRIHLTEKYGVVPDFILSPFISNLQVLKDSLNTKPIYEAKVILNGKDLKNVGWKEFPNLQTCGVFRTRDSTLTPQKRGFMFSPDIYNFTDRNTKISGPKTFRAFKYNLDEKLRYSLPLQNEIINIAYPEDKSTQTDITFINDEVRGQVANFNGKSGYIDIRSEEERELEEISIAAWINPADVEGSYSLLGKGQAFSAKIYYGRLQFTAAGIRDHATSKRVINEDEWSHIAYVYVPGQKLYFYLNGKLIEQIPASEMRQTDHALLIGTNLWGQYYSGLMSDFKMWDRALSDDEVEAVFLNKLETQESDFNLAENWFLIFGVGLILLLLGFVFFNRKKGVTQDQPIAQKVENPILQRDFGRNSITLLNGFKVRNHEGIDITSKFSPKRRELVILVLLFTLKEGGITSKKLSDILWPGYSPKSKKNNRSTQIKEIRKIFEDQVDAEILFKDKKWQFEIGDSGKVDVFNLNTVLPDFWASKKRTLSQSEVLDFSRIVSRGALLPQIEEEWLDTLKAEYNSRILDLLSPFLEDNSFTCKETLEIVEAILVVDPLYETAVKRKVSCLLEEGKYGSAKKVIENYKKLYESYYNETIDPEFLKLIK